MKTLLFATLVMSLSAYSSEVKDRDDIPEVFQREYIFTNAGTHDYVQTYGVYTCVALSLYDKESKSGILAHLDAQTDIEKELPKLKRDLGNGEIEARVFGGLKGSAIGLPDKVLKVLKKLNIPVVEQDIYQESNESKSVMLDLNTGKVVNYEEMVSSTDYQISQGKVDRIKFGKRLYRHMDSLGGGDPVSTRSSGNNPYDDPFGFNPPF